MYKKPFSRSPGLSIALLLGGMMFWMACGRNLAGEGASCTYKNECAGTLDCIGGKCGFGLKEGVPCTLATECAAELKCISGRCTKGSGKCESQKDCPSELRCIDGACVEPGKEGTACTEPKGCLAPFVCNQKGTCQNKGTPGTKGSNESCGSDDDCQKTLACEKTKQVCLENGSQGLPCKTDGTCATGLICSSKMLCTKEGEPGTGGPTTKCQKATECRNTFTCSSRGLCAPSGAGVEGDDCAGNENCQPAFVCAPPVEGKLGKCTKPGAKGTKQSGESCVESAECGFGMICGLTGECAIPQTFEGVKCEDPGVTTGPFRVFFEIPRKDQKITEFYRLPFPNDIRLKSDGFINLSGHPNPGPIAGEDLLGKYIKAIETEMKAFGNNQTIFFRFSQSLDFDSLVLNGDKPTMMYINLDTKRRVGISVTYSAGKNKFICHNSLSIRTYDGLPLDHGQTYAILIINTLKSKRNDLIKADKDFEVMLQDTPPTDPDLLAAYDRYKKLRDYLKANETDKKWPTRGDLAAATVFTTQDPDKDFGKFREVVYKQAAPTLKELTLCDGKNKSPCASKDGSDKTRECGEPSSLFYEFHAKVEIPVFQTGTAPYLTEGGKIEYDADGNPKISRTEEICVAFTIPKEKAPPGGWPMILYSHGTGGNFKGHISNKTAERLSKISLPDGKSVGYATLGFDQVLHASRRNGSEVHPNFLFFNFRNPHSSKDNPIQGAADHFTFVRLLKELKITKEVSPTNEEILFNNQHIVFVGHSQGGIVGPLFLPYEPDITATVMSGAGGSLIQSLLNKTQPVNIAAGVQLALGEVGTKIDQRHPALNLFQLYFERSDALNYAGQITLKPNKDINPKHVLLTYGVDDTFTPNETTAALALAMGVTQIKPVLKPIGGISSKAVDGPIQGNTTVNKLTYTNAIAQYKAEGYDGHFVFFQHPDAKRQVERFLGTYLTDPKNIPTLLK